MKGRQVQGLLGIVYYRQSHLCQFVAKSMVTLRTPFCLFHPRRRVQWPGYHQVEIQMGSIVCAIGLPGQLDAEKVTVLTFDST